MCELPYELPIISNGGNDIGILKGKEKNTVTVLFWIHRNFFEAPSTNFIYTNDPEQMEKYEQRIRELPEYNWKLRENWYRISDR